MRIEKIALKGFLRFRDAVTLDLRELPPGLVAIVGANGEGKSTLLEAAIAGIYRSFPSRDKELFAYASERDSFLDVEFAVDGRGAFRARVNVDGPKRGSDAVLEQVGPDGTRVVLNDGKVSTFDAAVAREFPPKDLLLASAFAAQNKTGSFISLDKKSRKNLFMALLGIERYQTMSETARQAASLVDQAGGRLRAVRDVLVRDTAQTLVDELDRLATALQVEGGDAEVRRADLQKSIAALEARRDIVQDQVAAYVAAIERQRALDAEQATRQAERVDIAKKRLENTTALQREEQTIARKQTDAETTVGAERGAIIAKRDQAVADAKGRIAKNDDLIARAVVIRAAVAGVAEVEANLAYLRGKQEALRAEKDRAFQVAQRADADVQTVRATVEERERLTKDVRILETVPCGGAGDFAACQFLKNATAAKARIAELDGAGSRLEELQRLRQVRIDAFETLARQLAAFDKPIATLEAAKAEHQMLAKDAEYLSAAEARIAELTDKIKAAETDAAVELESSRVRYSTRLDELTADRKAAKDRFALRETELNGQQNFLDATIIGLGDDLRETAAAIRTHEQGHAEAVLIDRDLAAARIEWDATTAIVARVTAGRADLERRRQALAAKKAELSSIDGRLRTLDAELLDWQLLAKALGRDGLPVLEIDAAGPTISAYVNELLQVCFGSRFTVELATQQAKADGKGQKEDFTVRVFDNLRGGEPRDIADLSGGEQVIVSEALMNAIAVYVNTRSAMPVRTCWRDETTGALDPENASRYLAMLRKVQELGGFHHVLFITHNPDAAALADAQVHVQGGTVTTSLPPFAEAA